MKIRAGWIEGVKHLPSPNFDERPDGEVTLLIVHNISLPGGHFGNSYVEALFSNQLPSVHGDFAELTNLKVSSHLFIRRSGELVQFVPFHQRAWHAGQSCYQGRANCNDFSIGIELEGTDETPYREEQYQTLSEVCRILIDEYGLEGDAITGHSDVAPDRKTDPGPAFDWDYLRKLIRK